MAIVIYTFKEPLRVEEISRDVIDGALMWSRHNDVQVPTGHNRDITPLDYLSGHRLQLRTFTRKIYGVEDTVGEISVIQTISAQNNGSEGGSSTEIEEVTSIEPINGTASESVIIKHIDESTDLMLYSIIRYIDSAGSSRSSRSQLGDDTLEV